MTERLHDLLTREAEGLDVPAPPTGDVLSRGKGVRRRRRVVVGAAALATVVAVGGGSALLLGGDGPGESEVASAIGTDPVFAAGTTVFYGDGAKHATIDDKAIKSMFYTSAGVLVRHGDNPWSDGGGPQRFSLVTPDGQVRALSLVTEETVHVTDADQPYVAYAENRDGRLTVVVYDVESDAVETTVDVGATKETWFPVSIDGASVWVQDGYDGGSYRVDWRAGEVAASEVSGIDNVVGGYATKGDGRTIVDARTGETVLEADGPGSFELSTTGGYAQLVAGSKSFEVYDVDSGSHVTIDGNSYDWAWTADDTLFRVGDDEVTTCDPATGECDTAAVDIPDLGKVEGQQSTMSELVPSCMFDLPKDVKPGEVVKTSCPKEPIDCHDEAQRHLCEEIKVDSDDSFEETIILGGQIRES